MRRLRIIWNKFVLFDNSVHQRLINRFPRVVPGFDRSITWIVNDLLSDPLFAVILALVLLVLALVTSNVAIPLCVEAAYLITFLWIAKSKNLLRLSILTRVFILLFIATILGVAARASAHWAVMQHERENNKSSDDRYKSGLVFEGSTTAIGKMPQRQQVDTWDHRPWSEETYSDVRVTVTNNLDVPIQNLQITLDVTPDDKHFLIAAIGQLSKMDCVQWQWPKLPTQDIHLRGKDGKSYDLPLGDFNPEARLPSRIVRITCNGRIWPKDGFRLILGTEFQTKERPLIPPDHIRVTGSYEMAPSEGGSREKVGQTFSIKK